MNDTKTLINIFSKFMLLKNRLLILNGSEARAYTNDNGEWYVESEVADITIALNDFKDFAWSRNIVTFTCGGKGFDLQFVEVLDLNQFRFAK